MRRFVIGLLVGLVAVWLIVRWRLGAEQPMSSLPSDTDTGRIALPDLPSLADAGEDVAQAEPVVASDSEAGAAEPEDEAVQLARDAIEAADALVAYCARCRTKRTMANVEAAATQDGRPAVRGTCPVCGANMFRFV